MRGEGASSTWVTSPLLALLMVLIIFLINIDFLVPAVTSPESHKAANIGMVLGERHAEGLEFQMKYSHVPRILAAPEQEIARNSELGTMTIKCGNLVQYSPCIAPHNMGPHLKCGTGPYKRSCSLEKMESSSRSGFPDNGTTQGVL